MARVPRICLLVLPVLLLLGPAPRAAAGVEQWVDRDGVVHYRITRDEHPKRPRRATRAPAPRNPTELPSPRALPSREPFQEAPLPGPRIAEPTPPVSAGPAFRPSDPPDATGEPSSEIAELEQQIGSYREELKQIISEQSASGVQWASHPRVRTIADELPRLQAQLDELRREGE